MTQARIEGKAPIRVVVVDDSLVIRTVMRAIIDDAPDMECAGVAEDAASARVLIRETSPDVITLDVEMPGMDGLDFLERIMRLKPTPVVMMSTLTEQGSEIALRALELGAVEVLGKPRGSLSAGLGAAAERIQETLRAAAGARVGVAMSMSRAQHAMPPDSGRVAAVRATLKGMSATRIIAIGASTGGTEAIKDVLSGLDAHLPGIVITQHMPERFTRSFAERLDKLSIIKVKEAEQGEPVLPGHAYVAPGHSHLSIVVRGQQLCCELTQGPPVNRHRPSVDVLFDSVASVVGARAVGVLLTGMGRDGADGLLRMRTAGATTIAQSERSCVVYGMPREAVANGGAAEVIDLAGIAARITQLAR